MSASASAGSRRPEPCGDGCTSYATSRAAFEAVLGLQPRVLGLGEYHEMEGGPKVPSALKHFTRDLLPALAGKASSLTFETWVVSGRCGAVEKQAVAEVKKVTKRPASTEDEITTALGAAHDLGIAPHILQLDCPAYQSLLDPKGELDPEKTLSLVATKMHAKADELLDEADEVDGGPRAAVVLYGGAIHNQLYPDDDMKDYAFGPQLAERTGGHYVALDLCVPEYVADDADLRKVRGFAEAMKVAGKGRTALLNPRPNAYLLFFPRGK
jgi:hypothetical protein